MTLTQLKYFQGLARETALLPLLPPCKIHYIGSSGMEKELTKGLNLTYHEIASTKLVRSLTLKNLAIPFKLIKATREAKKLIDQIKPDLIFSKGGYVSLPVALASHKTPVILHESDKTLGLANKIALFKCDRLITSFGGFKSEKAICLGSPIRQSIYLGDKNKALNKCGLKKNASTSTSRTKPSSHQGLERSIPIVARL